MHEALQLMLDQLESHQLRVELAPLNPRLRNYNEGGCKRVVTDKPPAWYRTLCNRHQSSRGIRRGKFDTKIKRANVLRSLGRLAQGKTTGKYGAELMSIAADLIKRAA